ncbi:unnamed protein product [Vitrella brassicaformis CCMP3155]|uniref:Uncharacterized protein n=1 Tax=Vitrella brassicaformis (strain CCMP3155) TaxID=1169540 RepID=A0A0G4G3T1_VITBC|nr:unnamed protein product [Vitrella brassicaformis CCMP3155]|eukprot:CEM22822.1 unnamed protein product [Vitrella brassicaformis CCMP3155]
MYYPQGQPAARQIDLTAADNIDLTQDDDDDDDEDDNAHMPFRQPNTYTAANNQDQGDEVEIVGVNAAPPRQQQQAYPYGGPSGGGYPQQMPYSFAQSASAYGYGQLPGNAMSASSPYGNLFNPFPMPSPASHHQGYPEPPPPSRGKGWVPYEQLPRAPPAAAASSAKARSGRASGAAASSSSREEIIGYVVTKCNGTSHYDASEDVDRNDVLTLMREPDNIYDDNCIQVQRFGEQVGNLPRDPVASAMAPHMDSLGDSMILEAKPEPQEFRGCPAGTRSFPLLITVKARGGDALRVRNALQQISDSFGYGKDRVHMGPDPPSKAPNRQARRAASRNVLPRTEPFLPRGPHRFPYTAGMGIPGAAPFAPRGLGPFMPSASTGVGGYGGYGGVLGGGGMGHPGGAGGGLGFDFSPPALNGPSEADILERELEGLYAGAEYHLMAEADTPAQIQTDLLEHQRKALRWMIGREKRQTILDAINEQVDVIDLKQDDGDGGDDKDSKKDPMVLFWKKTENPDIIHNIATKERRSGSMPLFRGGILADDMGLGKTVTTLSLICANGSGINSTEPLDSTAFDDPSPSPSPSPSDEPPAFPSDPHYLPGLAPSPSDSDDDDDDMDNDFGLPVMHKKRKVEGAGGGGGGGGARKVGKGSGGGRANGSGGLLRGGTLVVCPLTVVANWKKQAEVFAPHLRQYEYYKDRGGVTPSLLASYDMVITTFNIVQTEFKNERRSSKSANLKAIHWHRIVLDEAHMIKNRKSQTAQAVAHLRATIHWSLTGTPIQNKVEDIYSLLHFLRAKPFDDWEVFCSKINKPIKRCDPNGFRRLQVVVRYTTLRRTKHQRVKDPETGIERPLLQLPQLHRHKVYCEFHEYEGRLYRVLYDRTQKLVKKLQEADELGKNFSSILIMLLRLRMLCCHSSLLPEDMLRSLEAASEGDIGATARLERSIMQLGASEVKSLLQILRDSKTDQCSICLEEGSDMIISTCRHVFHKSCLETHLKSLKQCPNCRGPVRMSDLVEASEDAELFDGDNDDSYSYSSSSAATGAHNRTSAKLEQIYRQIHVSLSQSNHGKPAKCVVFSQFTKFLDIIQRGLQDRRVPFVRLDGKMTKDRRQAAINSFDNDPHIRIFLVSLKAGGLGLNLTAANSVMLVDTWWNPAGEDQAVDRVHRIGQDREVHMQRILVRGSVEEKMLAVHDKKRQLAEGVMTKKTREELKTLMQKLILSIFQLDPDSQRQQEEKEQDDEDPDLEWEDD